MQNTPASSAGTEGLTGERLLLVTKLAMPLVRSDLVARPRLTNQLSLSIQRPVSLMTLHVKRCARLPRRKECAGKPTPFPTL